MIYLALKKKKKHKRNIAPWKILHFQKNNCVIYLALFVFDAYT